MSNHSVSLLSEGYTPTVYILPDYCFTTTKQNEDGTSSTYRNVMIQLKLPNGELSSRYIKESKLKLILNQYQKQYLGSLDKSCYAWMD